MRKLGFGVTSCKWVKTGIQIFPHRGRQSIPFARIAHRIYICIFFYLDRPLGKLIGVYISAKWNPVHFFLS